MNDLSFAYAKFYDYDSYGYKIITYLMNNDDEIWKILKYTDPDAWRKPALTFEEKASLIYAGQEDESIYNVFQDEGQINAWTKEATILRIFPYALFPDNRTLSTLTIAIDVLSHYRINHLSNYTTRVDTMCGRLLNLLNGANIGGIGVFFFDASVAKENREYPQGQIPFKGKRLTLSTKMG